MSSVFSYSLRILVCECPRKEGGRCSTAFSGEPSDPLNINTAIRMRVRMVNSLEQKSGGSSNQAPCNGPACLSRAHRASFKHTVVICHKYLPYIFATYIYLPHISSQFQAHSYYLPNMSMLISSYISLHFNNFRSRKENCHLLLQQQVF